LFHHARIGNLGDHVLRFKKVNQQKKEGNFFEHLSRLCGKAIKYM